MTDTFGARPWSEVINETGNGIRGALEREDPQAARNRADAESNRALHPATQKWLNKVLTGEMSPADAAAAAHQEIDASQQQLSGPPLVSPGSQGLVSYGDPQKLPPEPGGQGSQSGPDSVSMGPPPPAYSPQQNAAPQGLRGAVEGRGSTPTSRPFTVRDSQDLEGMSKFAQSQRPAADTLGAIAARGNEARKTEGVKQSGRQDLLTQHLTSNDLNADEGRKLKWQIALMQNKEKYDALDSVMKRVEKGLASNEEIAKARVDASILVANINEEGKIASGLNPESDASIAGLARASTEMKQKTLEIQRFLGIGPPKVGEPAGPQGPEYRPEALGKAAPNSSALPERKGSSTGTTVSSSAATKKTSGTKSKTPVPTGRTKVSNGVTYEEMSDGTARRRQ